MYTSQPLTVAQRIKTAKKQLLAFTIHIKNTDICHWGLALSINQSIEFILRASLFKVLGESNSQRYSESEVPSVFQKSMITHLRCQTSMSWVSYRSWKRLLCIAVKVEDCSIWLPRRLWKPWRQSLFFLCYDEKIVDLRAEVIYRPMFDDELGAVTWLVMGEHFMSQTWLVMSEHFMGQCCDLDCYSLLYWKLTATETWSRQSVWCKTYDMTQASEFWTCWRRPMFCFMTPYRIALQ